MKVQLLLHTRDFVTFNTFYFECKEIDDVVIEDGILTIRTVENYQHIFPWELVSSLTMDLREMDLRGYE